MRSPDAVVVGSGPNGLAAAVTLARAGLVVDVYEGSDTPGGGCRSEELTLPGYLHDVCSAVHPLLVGVPLFPRHRPRGAGREVSFRTPKVAFAHPLDGGRAGAVVRSVDETAASLGVDALEYRRIFAPLVRDLPQIIPTVPRASEVPTRSSAGDDALRPKRRSLGATSRQGDSTPKRSEAFSPEPQMRYAIVPLEQVVNGLRTPSCSQ